MQVLGEPRTGTTKDGPLWQGSHEHRRVPTMVWYVSSSHMVPRPQARSIQPQGACPSYLGMEA